MPDPFDYVAHGRVAVRLLLSSFALASGVALHNPRRAAHFLLIPH